MKNVERMTVFAAVFALTALSTVRMSYAQQLSGALYTTTKDATKVNWNIYATKPDVYISGGPKNTRASGLPDGTYYFQVTDPSGKTLLSTDNAVCRQLLVVGGRVAGATGSCSHVNGTIMTSNFISPSPATVRLIPSTATEPLRIR